MKPQYALGLLLIVLCAGYIVTKVNVKSGNTLLAAALWDGEQEVLLQKKSDINKTREDLQTIAAILQVLDSVLPDTAKEQR